MQSALIAIMVTVSIVTWLPEAARATKQSMLDISAELNKVNGSGPLVMAVDGSN